MFFSVVTKNSNWEISTENLVTFKREDGVKDENFNILCVHWKIRCLEEGSSWKNHIEGELPKKGGLEKLQI